MEHLRFLASNQTLSPLAKGVNHWLLCEDMTWQASSWTARASSQAVMRDLRWDSTAKIEELEIREGKTVMFCPYPFLFLDLSFLFRDYSSFPRHRPADYTCLRNRFLPSTSLDFYDSSLFTHCTSSQFHCIPPCFFCFVIFLELSESLVYKPSTCH